MFLALGDSIVDVLASLAAETSIRDSSQLSLELELGHDLGGHEVGEHDSVLSQVMLPLSADDRKQIVEESLEMSQRVWDEDAQQPNDDDLNDDDVAYVLVNIVIC